MRSIFSIFSRNKLGFGLYPEIESAGSLRNALNLELMAKKLILINFKQIQII
jgi:hypothetical protein